MEMVANHISVVAHVTPLSKNCMVRLYTKNQGKNLG